MLTLRIFYSSGIYHKCVDNQFCSSGIYHMSHWVPSSVLLEYTTWVTGYPVLFSWDIPCVTGYPVLFFRDIPRVTGYPVLFFWDIPRVTGYPVVLGYTMSHWVTSSWHSVGIIFFRNTQNWMFSDRTSDSRQTEPSITQLQEHQNLHIADDVQH